MFSFIAYALIGAFYLVLCLTILGMAIVIGGVLMISLWSLLRSLLRL